MDLTVSRQKYTALAAGSVLYVHPAVFEKMNYDPAFNQPENGEVQIKTHLIVLVRGAFFKLCPSEHIKSKAEIYFNLACRETAMVPFGVRVKVLPGVQGIQRFQELRVLELSAKPFYTEKSPAAEMTWGQNCLERTFRAMYGETPINRDQVFNFYPSGSSPGAIAATAHYTEGGTGFIGPGTGIIFTGPSVRSDLAAQSTGEES